MLMSYRSAFLCSSLLTLLVGCGGAQINHSGLSEIRIEAPGPAAAEYRTEPQGSGTIGIGADRIETQLQSAMRATNQMLTPDGRLAMLGRWIGERSSESDTASHEVVDFFAHHLGLVEAAPHFILGTTDEGTELELEARLTEILERQTYHHYGIAVVDREGTRTVVMVFSVRPLTLNATARAHPVGRFDLEGSLLEGYARPVVVLTGPAGRTTRTPLGNGPQFEAHLPMAEPGTYRVELLADGPFGVMVAANFPVYIGVEVPTSVVLHTVAAGDAAGTEAVASALIARLNETREAEGLSPLTRMTELDGVALDHSIDMQAHGFLGHRSPTTGDVGSRLQTASLRSGLILENIARGYDASEIHHGLMASPGHRANMLNDQVTHVGIGVTSSQDEGRDAFLVTLVFIRVNEAMGADSAAFLLEAINAAREARGADALEAEPNLTAAAQEAADTYFRDENQSQQDVVDDASRGLRRFAIAYRRIGGLMTIVSRIEEAQHLEPTLNPEVGFVGIGVAQGSRADSPPNSIGVVILMAWPRE